MQSQDIEDILLPDSPGVYFFVDGDGKILYIGKATSLSSRVRSYFSSDLSARRGDAIVHMIKDAVRVEWERTDTALEALFREATLIRKHAPPYNAMGKDDKSWNHAVVTDEPFPRVLVLRGKDLAAIEQGGMAKKLVRRDIKWSFGPFSSGKSLAEALKLIRRVFPYRDSCAPCHAEKDAPCAPCFNRQIGLCPGVCDGGITAKDYNRSVRHIKLFFDGKKKHLEKELAHDMKVFARKKEFEKAGEAKRQMDALAHVNDIALLTRDAFGDQKGNTMPFRIEAYDVAHLSGESTVGVMTVVSGGMPQKDDYRKFIIRGEMRGSDTGALAHMLERRLTHDEWPAPQLVVVDGSAAQMNVAVRLFRSRADGEGRRVIPVVGVVKDERHRPRMIRGDRALVASHERDIILANNEAHRFALRFHRKKRRL